MNRPRLPIHVIHQQVLTERVRRGKVRLPEAQLRHPLEFWWIWILADLIYIPLYIYKDLRLTSALYAIFMILRVVGLGAWQKPLPSANAGE